MNYKEHIKEGQDIKPLLKFNELTKEENISKRDNLKHLLQGYIFHPISTWKILKHDTITNKNTFRLILFQYGNGISSNFFIEYLYSFMPNTPSKIRKRTLQLHWIVTNTNTHQHKWYYFDMYHQPFLLFNCLKKN